MKTDSELSESRTQAELLVSPVQIRTGEDEKIRWWRPGWRDGVRYVGYRWIFLSPLALLLILIIAQCFLPGWGALFFVIGLKLFILSAAIAISLAAYVLRLATQSRREPFCIFCGYNLTGLPDNYRCPECGRAYSWDLIAEYRRDPQWFIERWKARNTLPPNHPPFSAGPTPRKRRARDGTE